ncbi:MAG: succinylglutamate desuccinylase/aspartoacylase family protein [Gammaproteobacteria bacterium]|nr:succinylglutamate desuccinylase/aspartoacylase family protein [Gammaproteobacteria bacterium]
MRASIKIWGVEVRPGERASIEIPVPSLYTHTQLEMPVQVIHGKKDGPTMFLSAALHGDEINGVEIIRRVLHTKSLNRLRGTLIAIPVVNIFGFINQSRYLPDRRDLNRSFPGSDSGSLAARIANLFLKEIVSLCTHGIDLHTGAIHRENLPQVRAVLDDKETERMARAFISPVILNTTIVEGSLREAVEKLGISVIVYEAGEALRFDEVSIRAGVRGVVSVMRELQMLPALKRQRKGAEPIVARSSSWVRAPQSGILRMIKPLGSRVTENELLGIVADPFGESEENVLSPADGIIVGKTNIPLVNEGEALFHVARFKQPDTAAQKIEKFQQIMDPATDNTEPAEPPVI